jgi:4-amino-4-deoxy-L-arabinose transferase-like glycosyltransferase
LVVLGAALGAAGLWLTFHVRHRALLAASVAVTAAALLAGPTAYSLTTIANARTGPLAAAGPTTVGTGGPSGLGGPGGLGGQDAADPTLVRYLESHKGNATYLVAAFGSQSSAPIIIASGQPVMTIGGFNGSDPAPTLAQFQQLVSQGKVRYVLLNGNGAFGGPGGGGPGGFGGPGGGNSAIREWVTAHGTTVDYGGSSTLYRVGQ